MQITWSQVGPRLEANAPYWATVASLVGYLAIQALALLAAALVFLGRATDRCLIGPECGLFAGGDFRVAFTTLALISLSIAIIAALGRFTRAVWKRAGWTAVVARLIGWVTLPPAVLMVFFTPFALAWVIVALVLIGSARGLRLEQPHDPNVMEAERV